MKHFEKHEVQNLKINITDMIIIRRRFIYKGPDWCSDQTSRFRNMFFDLFDSQLITECLDFVDFFGNFETEVSHFLDSKLKTVNLYIFTVCTQKMMQSGYFYFAIVILNKINIK